MKGCTLPLGSLITHLTIFWWDISASYNAVVVIKFYITFH